MIKSAFKVYLEEHNLDFLTTDVLNQCFENQEEDPKRFIVDYFMKAINMQKAGSPKEQASLASASPENSSSSSEDQKPQCLVQQRQKKLIRRLRNQKSNKSYEELPFDSDPDSDWIDFKDEKPRIATIKQKRKVSKQRMTYVPSSSSSKSSSRETSVEQDHCHVKNALPDKKSSVQGKNKRKYSSSETSDASMSTD